MDRKVIEKKTRVLLCLIVVIFTVLIGRLAYMQLLETQRFETLAKQNHMRLNPIIAPRGEIYDRKGVKIVGNKPVYTVSLVYLGLKDTDRVVNRVAGILGMDPREIMKKLEEQQLRLYQPVRLATDVPLETITVLEEQRLDLPGVVIDVEPVRSYPFKSMLAHVLGYVQEIKQEQLKKNQDKGYRLGDMYGQDGLENAFEPYLRGQDGARQVEVDAQARPVRDLGIKEPVPGNNLVLTIDAELQKTAEASLEKQVLLMRKQGYESKGGATVMIDVRTGAIRAMASYPTYDPAIWIKGLSQKQWEDLQKSGALPNRVLQLYPPASTFKMILAVAGMDTGKVDPAWAIADPGYYHFGDRAFNDWKPGGHGRVDMRKAISESCDTYFWYLGHRLLGVDLIGKYARKFGLGERTGIEIPGEPAGVVPTPDYKYKRNKAYLDAIYGPKFKAVEEKYKSLLASAVDPAEREKLEKAKQRELRAVQNQYDQYKWDLDWQVYDTLNMSIGQGYNLYTPLQLVNYIAALANNGTLWKPYLVEKVISPDGKVIKEYQPQKIGQVDVKPEALQVAREGMRMVTTVGTAAGIFSGFPVEVAGKTGTGEVFGHDNHALFVAFAPYDKPEVAVATVIDYGGHGGSAAGPVARDLFAAYFGVANLPQRVVYSPE
ncbi:penicillin-binding protein 2 [Desulforamulus hydrothermalis]|uniref:Peptidoglycan glycosyltransferase n=1 Tax=Desulforamulus hydrothermalis Lam5 = DSM 18033 TaxID=1121428 RepID=K8DY95_9FIRM|nr:penicillin-binding protein 2 [Desulforamulus hydrothermalis]CCO07680.1 Peptidoglycan glycosyltransferase [Desulforamulus hydrothermalis Lam5 = DSM 18033]SHH25215.1 peptidoglycan glycosyltransferase [Desulforamulus hydrothermalis Lam5 = DSM 18033]